jgi:hypothetical protein
LEDSHGESSQVDPLNRPKSGKLYDWKGEGPQGRAQLPPPRSDRSSKQGELARADRSRNDSVGSGEDHEGAGSDQDRHRGSASRSSGSAPFAGRSKLQEHSRSDADDNWRQHDNLLSSVVPQPTLQSKHQPHTRKAAAVGDVQIMEHPAHTRRVSARVQAKVRLPKVDRLALIAAADRAADQAAEQVLENKRLKELEQAREVSNSTDKSTESETESPLAAKSRRGNDKLGAFAALAMVGRWIFHAVITLA